MSSKNLRDFFCEIMTTLRKKSFSDYEKNEVFQVCSEVYSEPSQISKMDPFAKIVNGGNL